MTRRGRLHHIEIWVADLAQARASLGWLFESLDFAPEASWEGGGSWSDGETYLVLDSGPDLAAGGHERRRPGLNHLAFHAGSEAEVEALAAQALLHGWSLLFGDRHPHAGGADHYAAYLEDAAGFEVELVASG